MKLYFRFQIYSQFSLKANQIKFTTLNTNMYNVLFAFVLSFWLCGSKGDESGFQIYRSDQDVFKNLNCYGKTTCSIHNCEIYGGECYSDDHCQYCRCSKDKRTFMINKDNPMQGRCTSDEKIVQESGMSSMLSCVTQDYQSRLLV